MKYAVWKILLFSLLTFSATPVGTAEISNDDHSSIGVNMELNDLNEKLQYYKQEVKCLNQELLELTLKDEGKLYFSPNIAYKKHIDTTLHYKIVKALHNYPGPPITLSSGRRSEGHRHSDHFYGKAVDISWRDNGNLFVVWLNTNQGKHWLDTHNLDYIIENVWEEKLHPNFMYNVHATGPHIHLHLK